MTERAADTAADAAYRTEFAAEMEAAGMGGKGKILGVDLGTVRTGLAVSDPSGLLASPVGTVTQRDPDRLAEQVAQAAREQAAAGIVGGHPRNMDGTRGESARRAEAFADRLRLLTGLPVSLWDERMTTVSAIGVLNETNTRGKRRKAVVDTVAATIILQDFLDFRAAHAAPASQASMDTQDTQDTQDSPGLRGDGG